MKLIITFKDPSAIDNAICDLSEADHEKSMDVARKWFAYMEYVDIEIDTVKGTAKIIPYKE
jgi:hypothetical protein